MINKRKIEWGTTKEYDPTCFYTGQRVIIYLDQKEGREHLVRQGVVTNHQAIRSIEGKPEAPAREKACLELMLELRGKIADVPKSTEHEQPTITEDVIGKKIERPYHYTAIMWAEEILE